MSTPPHATPTPASPAAAAAFDPVKLTESLAAAAEKSAKLMGDFATRNAGKQAAVASDELGLSKAYLELAAKMLTNPARIVEAQMNLWRDYMHLWQHAMLRAMGAPGMPVAEPA
jgi:polyhydroxyalkanoate synthase